MDVRGPSRKIMRKKTSREAVEGLRLWMDEANGLTKLWRTERYLGEDRSYWVDADAQGQ